MKEIEEEAEGGDVNNEGDEEIASEWVFKKIVNDFQFGENSFWPRFLGNMRETNSLTHK